MDYLDILLEANEVIQYRLEEGTNALLDWFERKLVEIENKLSDAALKVKKALLRKKEAVEKSSGDILKVDLTISVGGKKRKIADKGTSKSGAISKLRSEMNSTLSSIRTKGREAIGVCKAAIGILKAAKKVKPENIEKVASKKDKVMDALNIIGKLAGILASLVSIYVALS